MERSGSMYRVENASSARNRTPISRSSSSTDISVDLLETAMNFKFGWN